MLVALAHLAALVLASPATTRTHTVTAREFIQQGTRMVETGRVKEARAMAEKRLAESPGDAPGHLVLGLAYRASGRTVVAVTGAVYGPRERVEWNRTWLEDAKGQFERAVAADPGLPEAFERLVELYGEDGRALDLGPLIARVRPEAYSPAARAALELAVGQLLRRGSAEVVASAATAFLDRFPLDPAARRAAAMAWTVGGKLDRVIALAPQWRRESRDERWWTLALVEAHLLAGRLADAARLARGVEGDDRLARLAACIAAAQGERAAAARLRANTRASGPGSGVPAEPVLARTVELLAGSPGPPAAVLAAAGKMTELARELLGERRYVESALLLLARRGAPGWGDAEQLLLADLYKRIRDFRREIAALSEMRARVRGSHGTTIGVSEAEFEFRIGRALFHAGDLPGAGRAYARARALGKEDSDLYFHLAKLYKAQGRPERSREALERAATFSRSGPQRPRSSASPAAGSAASPRPGGR
jgi:tetratricopeptide (TPR) repeat protein